MAFMHGLLVYRFVLLLYEWFHWTGVDEGELWWLLETINSKLVGGSVLMWFVRCTVVQIILVLIAYCG